MPGGRGTRWNGQPVDRSFNLGTLCELALVRAAAVTPLPAGIPFPSRVEFVGCGVMTGFGSAVNVARVGPDDSVAVLGCGEVLQRDPGARLAGANPDPGHDSRESALVQARDSGATDTLRADPADADFLGPGRRRCGRGQTARGGLRLRGDLGAGAGLRSLRLIRDGGMALQVSSHDESGFRSDAVVHVEQAIRHAPLRGMRAGSGFCARVPEHYRRGELLLDELVTRTYPLEGSAEAIEDMLSGRNARG